MTGRWFVLVLALVLLALAARLKTGRPESSVPTPVQPAGQPAEARADSPAVPNATARDDTNGNMWRPVLEAALRDPFGAIAATLPIAHGPRALSAGSGPALPTTPPEPPASPAPAPSAPPTPGLTFAGRMVTPDGAILVIASLGKDTLTLRTGQLLPNGFRVDAIDADAVLLSHPALAQPARLAIPPAPRVQTR